MPDFAYEALTPTGAVERGRLTAASEDELEALLRNRGHFLITASPGAGETEAIEEEESGPSRIRGPKGDGNVPRKELLAFTEYLWGSAQAGVPIITTLEDVEYQVESKALQRVIRGVREAMLVEGKSLSEAMADFPKAFPQLYVGTIQAGETTGQLDYVLGQLVDYLEWQQEINLQVRQATLYPAIVFTLMIALIGLLVGYVYPRLTPVFMGYGVDLPLPTRIVLRTGELARDQWYIGLLIVATLVFAYHLVNRTPRGRLLIDTWKLRIPIFGKLFHQLEMARVVTYMALFYRTGIDLLRGLELLENIIKNTRVARAVARARAAIAGGDSVAHALSSTGLFPLIVVRSFSMGESTGKLDESLERAKAYYNREVPAAVSRMLGALQPMLIVVIGALIGLVALSIFLPVVQIYQNLSP